MTAAPAFEAAQGQRRSGETPARLVRGARTVDIIVVAVAHAEGPRALYGLLLSQAHSIVRLDAREGRGRVRRGSDGWELAANGAGCRCAPCVQCWGMAARTTAGRRSRG